MVGGFFDHRNQLKRFASPANADELRAAMNDMAAPGYAFETKYVMALAAQRRIEGQPAKLGQITKWIFSGS